MSASGPGSPPQAWRVRPAEPADAEAIVELLNSVYGHWGGYATWRWKYEQPPAGFRSPSAVAELDGRIVGHFGLLPVEAVLAGQAGRGGQTVDAAVLPAYRGRGIHTSLGHYVLDQAARAGIVLVYAFPGLFSLAVDQRIGYEAVAFMPEMVRVLQPGRALWLALRLLPGDLRALWAAPQGWTPEVVRRLVRLRRSLLILSSQVVDLNFGIRRRRPTRQAAFHLEALALFDERFDALWAQLQGHVGLGLRKDARYLTWRYHLYPERVYRVVAAVQGQEVLGFLVLRCGRLHSQIVELGTLPERPDVHTALLEEAIEQAREAGSVILSGWMQPRRPEHHLWRQAGFASQRRLHHLAWRWPALARQFYQVILYARHLEAGQHAQLLSRVPLWPLTLGDSDLV